VRGETTATIELLVRYLRETCVLSIRFMTVAVGEGNLGLLELPSRVGYVSRSPET
jgi:hypothetical protein